MQNNGFSSERKEGRNFMNVVEGLCCIRSLLANYSKILLSFRVISLFINILNVFSLCCALLNKSLFWREFLWRFIKEEFSNFYDIFRWIFSNCITEFLWSLVSEHYFLNRRRVLMQTESISDFGGIQWELLGIMLFAWLIVYFALWKGITQARKVHLSPFIAWLQLKKYLFSRPLLHKIPTPSSDGSLLSKLCWNYNDSQSKSLSLSAFLCLKQPSRRCWKDLEVKLCDSNLADNFQIHNLHFLNRLSD